MRERLRSKFLRTILVLAQSLERHEQWDDAIMLYRRASETDPLAEEFQRRLMLCYRAQGRIAEALDVYRRCRDLLSIALGVEPAAATQALYRSLKLNRS
jgi:DNA-binding SARP family transcriptional activator